MYTILDLFSQTSKGQQYLLHEVVEQWEMFYEENEC